MYNTFIIRILDIYTAGHDKMLIETDTKDNIPF